MMKILIAILFTSFALVCLVNTVASPCDKSAGHTNCKFKLKSANVSEDEKPTERRTIKPFATKQRQSSPCGRLQQLCKFKRKSLNVSEDGRQTERRTTRPFVARRKCRKLRHNDQEKTEAIKTTTAKYVMIYNTSTDEEIIRFLTNLNINQYSNRIGEESNQVTTQSPRQQMVLPPKRASSGINYQNLDDDIILDNNSTTVGDEPIFDFKPGDFIYPNSDPSTTIKTTSTTLPTIRTTTAKPPTTKVTEDNVFEFAPEDFDIQPVYTSTESNAPNIPSRVNPPEDGDSEEDEKNGTGTEAIPVEEDWDVNHPCNYDSLTHRIEIERTGRRVSDIQCEYNMWQYKYEILESERKRKECHDLLKNTEGITTVIRGKKAAQGEFPHMGAVGWRSKVGEPLFMCGSSLISTRFSITAAHCSAVSSNEMTSKGLANQWPEIVRFGSVYIKSEDDPNSKLDFVDIEISGRLIVLKKYRFIMKYNDVALIRLAKDVQLLHNIRPACLWKGHLSWSVANVTGWGQTDTERADSVSPHLLYAELDFVEKDICSRNIEGRISRRALQGLLGHQFCAGKLDGHVDTCQGDSGGPIQIQFPLPSSIDNSGIMYYLVGLTSFGIKCGRQNLPGIYVNVSDHNIMCWIERNVWPDEKNDHCPGDMFEGYEPPPKVG